MKDLTKKNIIEKIKSHDWDLRVTRPGFLQSKTILNEAEMQEIKLSKNAKAQYDKVFWIKDLYLYDDERTALFIPEFEKAFKEDQKWPKKIMEFFDKAKQDIKDFIKVLHDTDWKKESHENKIKTFLRYVELLKSIQKYYIIGVPICNFCESRISSNDNSNLLEHYAIPYANLDIDEMQRSIDNLRKLSGQDFENAAKEHLKRFAWIKTAYDIIQPYTEEDLRNELKNKQKNELTQEHEEGKKAEKPVVPENLKPYVLGLQIGIFIRNRMKEMSQQLWFHARPLQKAMALDLGISIEDFLQLTYHEVLDSCKKGECTVSEQVIQARHKGFCAGMWNNEEIILTGKDADELEEFFSKPAQVDINEIKGNTACMGHAKGKARLVLNPEQAKDFQEGEILVTTMTTPDFVIIMKKAAAIVTDEGGLSCHAAIVSRELGVPCVIGTKIATKAINNGDKLEVNADEGIIKKLN
ncbi:PEP-utilizing enzyme [Thermoproteota archaeon]